MSFSIDASLETRRSRCGRAWLGFVESILEGGEVKTRSELTIRQLERDHPRKNFLHTGRKRGKELALSEGEMKGCGLVSVESQ
ncbi:hypothetical protein [Cystobacter fuscus]|uniref:hypothetical protein n=1 Tax=Cystobacter fuscus TaxID=43 RepID=UPI0012DE57AF|nr:hypothetical protein [Cystobacter fuscus]